MTLLAITLARVLLTWALTLLMVVGVGAAVMRLVGDRPQRGADWVLAGWAGVALVTGALQVWHLAAPVAPVTYGALLFAGAVGVLWAGRGLAVGLWGWARHNPALLVGLVVVAALAANQTLYGPSRYDTGLYDIQVMLWTRNFAIVPGLGNLHGRFAFNNSTHLWFSLLDAAPTLIFRGTHLGNGVPLLLLLAGGMLALGRVLRERATDAPTLYALALTPLALRHLLYFSLYNPDSDLFVLLAGLVVLGEVLRLLTAETVPVGRLATLALLVGWGVTVKLSFAVLGAGLALVGWWAWWRRVDGGRGRGTVVAVGAGLALVVPWLWRGVLLSGYPLFPSTVVAAPVDWQMVPAAVELETLWVRAWARQHGDYTVHVGPYDGPVVVGWGWLAAWFLRSFTTTPNLFDVTLPLLLAGGALGTAVVRRVRDGRWWALGPLGVAGVFWFVFAPDPRFAGALWWGTAALALALVGAAALPRGQLRGGLALVGLLCFAFAPLQVRLVFPASGEVAFYAAPAAQVEPRRYGNVLFWFPAGGADQCWNAPLPCAPPYPQIDGFCMREPGNLAAGFANVDGPHATCTQGYYPWRGSAP